MAASVTFIVTTEKRRPSQLSAPPRPAVFEATKMATTAIERERGAPRSVACLAPRPALQ